MADADRHLMTIFTTALDHEAGVDRSAYLDQACGEDAALRDRVEGLLRVHGRGGRFLEPDPARVQPTSDQPVGVPAGKGASDSAGKTVMAGSVVAGRYKLLEEIGEGGMGAVWMAEQTEPVQRRVAVKLIKPGMDSKQVVARFEAERQALALMDHPNIARVLDGGATEDGRPFFVMELVKGTPITKYCDEKKLPVRDRLELFADVCRAVQHAHQKGIIHRDLKPSNVLVAPYDGWPVVKVIDFGIAKATGQKLTDTTLFTGIGAVVGTPEYMSPEQAETNNQDIDTRSDVYSLGILLYELLTGSTPLTRQRVKEAALLEVLRLVREEEPPRPSTRLSSTEELPSIAAVRGVEPARLSKLVRGELDWIVMKALDKDRNRRYETANGFAADVQRYLADEPVQACPPSVGYRLRKFARRNRGRLTAAAVIGVAVLVAVGGVGWALRDREARQAEIARERREREEEAKREKTERERRVATQVELILEEVKRLEGEQKWPQALAAVQRAEAALTGGSAAETARQVRGLRRNLEFVARLDRIRQELSIPVEEKWDQLGTVGKYRQAFQEYGVDLETLPTEEAIARLRVRPALAVPVAAALDHWCDQAVGLGVPEVRWHRLLAVARGLDRDTLRDRLRAGWLGQATPKWREELRRLSGSIDVREHSPVTLVALARTLDRLGLPEEAAVVLRAGQYAHPTDLWLSRELVGRDIRRKEFAEAVRYAAIVVAIRPNSSRAHNDLGTALGFKGQIDEAIACYRKAIAIDPNLAPAHYNLGGALMAKGQVDEAIGCYRKAIEIDPKNAWALNNLGNALREKGQIDEAIASYRKAIDIDPKHAKAHAGLGLALKEQGQMDEAIAYCRKAIELDPKLAAAHNILGLALMAKGQVDAAISSYRKAIEVDPKDAKAPLINLGNALHRKDQLDEAIACFRQAIELDSKYVKALTYLGDALRDKDQVDEAIAHYLKAINIDPKYPWAHYSLGIALHGKGQLDEAAACFRKAIALDPKNAKFHFNLGVTLQGMGQLDEAAACYREAIRLSPNDAGAYVNLGQVLRNQARFADALEALRRGHKLGSKEPNWRYSSDRLVKEYERLVELDRRLPDLLARNAKSASAAERIELARLCALKRLNRTAVRFYEEAFAAEPKLTEALSAHCYNAACVAALAGCGRGKDAELLDEKERARLRRQALDWLRAELGAWGRLLDNEPDKAAAASGALQHWQADTDFFGVRGPKALAKLPEVEQTDWQKLWDDAAQMLERARAKPATPKKPGSK